MTIFQSSPKLGGITMKLWMSKTPRVIVDRNFSFSMGPESVVLNYKVADDEALHSIEIRLRDFEAFKNTVRAMEKEIESTKS
jgi:hypothetical protein